MFAKVVIILSSWWNFRWFLLFPLYFSGFFFQIYSVSAIVKIIHVNKNKNKDNYKYYRAKKKKKRENVM